MTQFIRAETVTQHILQGEAKLWHVLQQSCQPEPGVGPWKTPLGHTLSSSTHSQLPHHLALTDSVTMSLDLVNMVRMEP